MDQILQLVHILGCDHAVHEDLVTGNLCRLDALQDVLQIYAPQLPVALDSVHGDGQVIEVRQLLRSSGQQAAVGDK